MAELEIHHETEHAIDPIGQKIGILAAVLAVCLAVVTIASHRTHTAAIMHQSTANDDWAHYQSTRAKYHNLELGEDLMVGLGIRNQSSDKMLADYAIQMKKYEKQGNEIQTQAQGETKAAERDERRGLRYDLGEGLLEIALVLTSLYFISHKMLFPTLGLTAGIAGVLIAVTALLA
ncbi:MAG TPA: DUF4337 domain-containing protein [Bryobacteraceae bacterium]|nr:DUF4337 domain-containing protein [Bryobacteraceae bacterium]